MFGAEGKHIMYLQMTFKSNRIQNTDVFNYLSTGKLTE